MIELGVNQIKKQFGETIIFENITFELKTGERVGLIGANGVGKTTILKILMGEENHNDGKIFKRKGVTLGYLNQIPDYHPDFKAIDVIKLAFNELQKIKEKIERIEEEMSFLEESDILIKRYGELSTDFERLGGYMMDIELAKILTGLQINKKMQQQKFQTLSGGEQTRIVLAKILLERPDVLLLDEPSNHLDIESIEWLENYLDSYEGAILIISHDRYFLDQVVNRIIELTYDDAIVYHGNYTYYTTEKERRFLIAMKHYEQQQKKVKRVEEQIKRYRIWGEMRDSDKMYKRAKELEKRLEKMEKFKKPVYENRKVSINMDIGQRSGKKVVTIRSLAKSFDQKEVIKNVEFDLWFRDFMCILGGNGTGKTTLFQIIMENLKQDHGEVKLGSRVKIGYLPQHIEFDNEQLTILEYFTSVHQTTNSEARKQLAKALFVKDDVFKKVCVLSGGEKSRLKLNTLMYGKINVLLLDEPTNHLDIDSREVLEENLLSYEGTVLFISHDRYFIDKMASKIGELLNGTMKIYNGTYNYYKEEREKAIMIEVKNKEINDTIQSKVDSKNYNKSKNINSNNVNSNRSNNETESEGKILSKNAQKLLVKIEEEIEILESELTKLEDSLIEVGTSIDKLNDTMKIIDNKKEELNNLYEKWEQLTI